MDFRCEDHVARLLPDKRSGHLGGLCKISSDYDTETYMRNPSTSTSNSNLIATVKDELEP